MNKLKTTWTVVLALILAVLLVGSGVGQAAQPTLQDGDRGTMRQPVLQRIMGHAASLPPAQVPPEDDVEGTLRFQEGLNDAPSVLTLQQIPGTLIQLPSGRGAYGPIATLVDAGGNTFNAYKEELEQNANITWVEVRRYAPDGTQTGQWPLYPLTSFKIDAVGMFHSGDDLKVTATNHTYTTGRAKDVELGTIPDVFVFTPQFSQQRGGAGAFQPGQDPPPTNCNVDYDRIQAMLNAQTDQIMRTLRTEIAGCPTCSLRQGIEDKAKDAIREERVMTEAMFAGGSGSHIVYAQLVNTSYSGALSALNTYGACRIVPIPTPGVP